MEIDEFFDTSDKPVQVDTAELDNMIRKMDEAWAAYEEAKKQADECKEYYDKQEFKVMETLKAINKTKYHVDGIGTFAIRGRSSYPTPKTPQEREEFRKYLINRYGPEFAESMFTVNSQTLQGFVKKEEEVNPGQVIPGLGSPTVKNYIVFPKASERKNHG